MERLQEKFSIIANAIKEKRQTITEIKLENMGDEILKIKNGLEVNNGIVKEDYYRLYNENLYPGAMIKIAESCDVNVYTKPESKLYSVCLSNEGTLQYAYTNTDDIIYLQLNHKTYILENTASYFLQLVSVEEIERYHKYKVYLNIDNQYAEIFIDDNEVTTVLHEGILENGLIFKKEGIMCNDYLLTDVTAVFNENSYVTNDYDLYINGEQITKLPEGAIAKNCITQENKSEVYYLLNNILYKMTIFLDSNYVSSIEVINLDIDYQRPCFITTIVDNKVAVLYNDIADNCLHFTVLNDRDCLLAKDIFSYQILYKDEKNLILLINSQVLHFKITRTNKCATKLVKSNEKMDGLCICDTQAMIGDKVRILLPKEDK